MDNPVFVAMEMPRFEIIIKDTSSSVESLSDGSRSLSAEASQYAAEPDLSDYVATVDQARLAPAAFRR